MTPRYVALVTAGLLLSSCGGRLTGPATGPYSPGVTSTMTVQSTITAGPHGPRFTEGAVPEIRLVAADGTTVSPAHDHRATAVFGSLAPGRYRLEATLRPCDGNCGYLDGPTASCAATVRVPGKGTISVTWRDGRGCRVVHRRLG